MRNYFTFSSLTANGKSGLTVALISIPLSISLAVASGVSPIAGIITAIWAGAAAALFGGSNYNIIGPTGALSGIIAAYALTEGPALVPSLAVMAGIFIVLAYAFSLERYLIFIPSSVIHGFILGVACIIALNQINFALGLQNLPKHGSLIENIFESIKHLEEISWFALSIFALFFAALVALRKCLPAIPGVIIMAPLGILLGSIMNTGLISMKLETLGSKFGTIAPTLIHMPILTGGRPLLITGLVVAFVAILETMLSAKIADIRTKTKHNARREILGLGLANIVSGLAGGFPATAALARTSSNINAGATSKVSALLASFFIAVGSLLFLAYFSSMPMAVIAAILVYVAVTMVERQHFVRFFQHDKPNFSIALIVAGLTVYEDPMIGILAGSVIALLFLVRNLATSYYEVIVHETKKEKKAVDEAEKRNILVYTFKGKLVYLNSQAHLQRFQENFIRYEAMVLVLEDLYYIDFDGMDAIEEIIELIHSRGQLIGLVNPSMHIKQMFEHSSAFQRLVREGLVFDSLPNALAHF